jgi:hypothetical protein
VPYDPATWYALRITLEGNRIRCAVNGVNVFDVTDDAIPTGKTGLYNNGNDGGYFDNFIVMGSMGAIDDENVYFSDAFEGDTIKTDWEFIRGTWTLSDGAMRQTDNYWEGGYPHSGGVFALVGNIAMKDYTVSADIRSDDDDRMGLVFRFQDEENFYAFSWDRELGERALVRVHQGKEDVLMSDTVLYDPGTWYAVRITLQGSRIRCAVDGVNVFDVTDDAIPSGKTGLYNNGNDGGYFDNFIVMMGKDSTVDVIRDMTPVGFSVGDPYPNPFNPFVTIDITVPDHSNVTIAIYDVLGRRVNILHNGYLTPGSHRVTWDGRDSSGTPVGSGLYIYRVTSGMFAHHGKMTLLR